MKAFVTFPIRSWRNAWKLAVPTDPLEFVQDRQITLEIQSDGATGYHLVVSPEGCFTADTWHESMADAKETARDTFGVAIDAWEL
jgi:hypothetical protein